LAKSNNLPIKNT